MHARAARVGAAHEAGGLDRVRSAADRGAPVVTYSLIGITALVYLLQWIPGLGVTNALVFSPVFMTEVIPEPWRALTSVFLHSTSLISTSLLNMYTLWIFGRLLEPMLGRIRFLALYLISGLAGSVGVVVFAAPNAQVLGASGAIFGLMGAFIVIQRRLGGNMTQLYILLGDQPGDRVHPRRQHLVAGAPRRPHRRCARRTASSSRPARAPGAACRSAC